MATSGFSAVPQRILRHSAWDALLVCLAGAHGALLLGAPSVPLIAIGLWWNANTVAHNFIHRPFFRARAANRVFAMYLTAVLGVPQELWRERHLWHHTGVRPPRRWVPLLLDFGVILGVWTTLAWRAPSWLAGVYLPGILIGLALCHLQGHFEHVAGTTSHYGRVYNWLFFNDGLHVEHHRQPGTHWSHLPAMVAADTRTSQWPPVLRWLELVRPRALDGLERIVLGRPAVRRFLLRAHASAFRALAPTVPAAARITIVGGGLFPRSAIIARALYPNAAITIIDARPDHLALAGPLLDATITTRCATYSTAVGEFTDVLVIPLAFVGDRSVFYERPPAPIVLVHDWVWHRRGTGVVISWWLLKRLNLVRR